MTTETRITRILSAPSETLAAIDNLLEGKGGVTADADRRLLTFTCAAEAMNLSRQSVWRMCKDGRLPTVEIRPGTRRIPSAAITRFIEKTGK